MTSRPAEWPPSITKSPPVQLYGDSIVVPYFNSFPGPVGVYRLPRPLLTPARRGLAIAPGGTNHLFVSAGTGS